MSPGAGISLGVLGCAAAAVHAAAPPPDALRAGLALFVLLAGRRALIVPVASVAAPAYR